MCRPTSGAATSRTTRRARSTRTESNGRRSRARFDDPVAQTCHYSEKPAGGGFTKADAVAECRAKLVVLSVGRDSNPATDAVAAPAADPRGEPAAPAWLVVFGVVSVLLLVRRPVVGRR